MQYPLLKDNKTKKRNIAGLLGFGWSALVRKKEWSQDIYITQGNVSHCNGRHQVAVDILLRFSISNTKPEHQTLEKRVHKNGTI